MQITRIKPKTKPVIELLRESINSPALFDDPFVDDDGHISSKNGHIIPTSSSRKPLPKIKKVIRDKAWTLRPFKPHQQLALDYIRKEKHPGLLMAMRLGKTLSIIRAIKEKAKKNQSQRCLVLAPKSPIMEWIKELTREGETFIDCRDMPRDKREKLITDTFFSTKKSRIWILCNVETLVLLGHRNETLQGERTFVSYDPPDMASFEWDLVVIDETTKIGNPDTHVSKISRQGFREAKRRSIFTGRPTPEGEHQLWAQLAFLDQNGVAFGCNTYSDFIYSWFTTYGGGSNAKPKLKYWKREEFYKILHERCFVMTREDAGLNVPIHFKIIDVPMSTRQRELYNRVQQEYAFALEDGNMKETMYVITMRLWLRKICGGFSPDNRRLSSAKAYALLSLLQKLKAENETIHLQKIQDLQKRNLPNKAKKLQAQSPEPIKVVVWFAFRHEVQELQLFLRKKGIDANAILGGMAGHARDTIIQGFIDSPTDSVLLATEDVAKFGGDYSVAMQAVYYSNSWSGEARIQSQDRIVSVFDIKPRNIYDLTYTNSIDKEVRLRVLDKDYKSANLMNKAIDNFIKMKAFEDSADTLDAKGNIISFPENQEQDEETAKIKKEADEEIEKLIKGDSYLQSQRPRARRKQLEESLPLNTTDPLSPGYISSVFVSEQAQNYYNEARRSLGLPVAEDKVMPPSTVFKIMSPPHKRNSYEEWSIMPFGKHKGELIRDLPTSYLKWCVEESYIQRGNNGLLETLEVELWYRTDRDD